MAVIKSLDLSKLVYISSMLPTPQTIIKQVNQLIFNFLWKGKDKVIRLSTIKMKSVRVLGSARTKIPQCSANYTWNEELELLFLRKMHKML